MPDRPTGNVSINFCHILVIYTISPKYRDNTIKKVPKASKNNKKGIQNKKFKKKEIFFHFFMITFLQALL